jgi:basic membrane lipoprotein Med (substrate-binding protein (PBP1-ABC) superfamily)
MAKLKYPRDEKGRVILGTQENIIITRPWNDEMYAHNEKVASKMKIKISEAIDEAYDKKDREQLATIGKELNGHGYATGYPFEEIYLSCLRGLKNVENFWLHTWAWERLAELRIVEPIAEVMVGYDKLKN